MTMNKVKGNMYSFFNQPPYRGCTWNPIKGLCIFQCPYCFMAKMYRRYNKWGKDFRLDDNCLKDNLGENNYIFVGSSTDMWCDESRGEWIERVLEYCKQFPKNQYFFQSKNPERFIYYNDRGKFPAGSILTTTIETNRNYNDCKAPVMRDRVTAMGKLDLKKMITVEPIMSFDTDTFTDMIRTVNPFQVNIGADSGNNGLPEPSPEKIKELICNLELFTKVHLKPNLKRLYNG